MPPTVDEVRAICRIDDSIIRNLRITDCYHRLSSGFAAHVGPGANWCTFATWASRQAGCTIRGEDMIELVKPDAPRLWRWLLRQGLLNPRRPLGWIVQHVHTPFDAVERASRSVAVGNLKVFEEIGEVFAAGLAEPDFRPEQPLLREAFAHYREARQEPDANRRSRLILFANLKCGWHEQTRLQPEIAEAMKSPLQTVNDLAGRFLPVLRQPVQRFTGLVEDLACRIVTGGFMTLRMPNGERLRLGKDLTLPMPACFDGVEREELIAQFDSAGHGGAGAENWADLSQRMRYIAVLFRCLHQKQELFQSPFNDAQRSAIFAGQLPRGLL